MNNLIRFIPELRIDLINLVSTLETQSNWGLNYVGTDTAWSVSKGENVKIAVIDTGWTDHPDLVNNLIQGFDATGNNDFRDRGNYHGTHVSGIVSANCGDRFGVMGVAPLAKLYPIKALNDEGMGSYSFIEKSLDIALDLDVDLVNMSLGSASDPGNDKIHTKIKQLADQGKIVVCAAGNDGGSVNYPARYDEVIAVAALDAAGNMARFSSRGPELDAVAPGVKIYSTWGDGKYTLLDGTSMACPMICGMIALIISSYKKNNPTYKTNYQEILKTIYHMGENNLMDLGAYRVAVPKFCNFNWN